MPVDVTQPHIGRIYDYVLGGTFNHEVDRRAAEAVVARMPAYPRWARANRAFLARVGERWASEGRAHVLDIGSGLPTQGHFDTRLADARILFSDIDPATVSQGRDLLAGAPQRAYVEADARVPDALLAQAAAFFGAERHLAVGCIGVVYFLSDDAVRRLMEQLHAFCAPGSALAVSFAAVRDGDLTDDLREVIRQISAIARIEFFHRTPEQIVSLIAPWRPIVVEPIDPPDGGASPLERLGMFGLLAERT